MENNNATPQERTLQFNRLYNEVAAYAEKNNLVKVYVCLPNNYKYHTYDLLYNLKNGYLNYFFQNYEKEDRFINALAFGKSFNINMTKGFIKQVKQTDKMQEYYSNNTKNDMFVIKYHDGYAILAPEKIANLPDEGNQEKVFTVDLAPYIVGLKEEEILPFVESYNNQINQIKKDMIEGKKYEADIKMKYKSKQIIVKLLPYIIMGAIILVLLKMLQG